MTRSVVVKHRNARAMTSDVTKCKGIVRTGYAMEMLRLDMVSKSCDLQRLCFELLWL